MERGRRSTTPVRSAQKTGGLFDTGLFDTLTDIPDDDQKVTMDVSNDGMVGPASCLNHDLLQMGEDEDFFELFSDLDEVLESDVCDGTQPEKGSDSKAIEVGNAQMNKQVAAAGLPSDNMTTDSNEEGATGISCFVAEDGFRAMFEVVRISMDDDEKMVGISGGRKRKCVSSPAKEEDRYMARRMKNNEASKISRQKRKMRCTDIEQRAMTLQEDNDKLEKLVEKLEAEVKTLRAVIVQRLAGGHVH
ncbi:PREDICTED: transcription factor HY5-like isoform X2 [Priapulus caudatus]|uniref:Transcription factor HY5-like isoform X2 n=2 Tax=Priapulus caudatus TaxID=37621 RepID=A0ABM1FBS1_PRICU|nr:PREDICTED: transcription factor HY5-like isoform X2 [Priapulus caudatus]